MMSQIDHRKSFETLFEADASIFRDVILRRLLIGVTSVFFSLFLDTGIYALWGAGYVIGDYFYVRLLRHPLDKVSRLRFWIACMASITLALWIAAMATYLSFVNGGEMHAIAACVVVGQALHCLSSHNKFGAAVNLDLTAVSLSTAGVTLGTAFNVQSASLAPAIIFAALAVTIYFIHSVRKAIAERMALHKRVEAEVQDQKMKALGQFTSGVAHDFNNMLTVIGGNIELARLHTLPPPSQEVLDEALNASENAAGLVKQLLAYSRKSTLQADQIEANALITRVAKVASRLLPANVALETVTIKTPTYVNADQSMLETAILNLVLNARDA
ncbi:MAG: histidine kinase dimerization/phospho-acceptor domain-containing protein, partial [Pseudomonadota bacterium]